MSIELALKIHCVAMTVAILAAAVVLHRRGLLTVVHSGTWLLFGFSIYFVYNPVEAILSSDVALYSDALTLLTDDGSARVFWILGLLLAGLLVFVVVYSAGRTRRTVAPPAPIAGSVPIPQGRWSVLQVVVLSIFAAAAVYSLLFLRTKGQFTETTITVEFDKGRVIGGATGYSIIAHSFFLFIVVILLYRGPAVARSLGLALALGFIALRLYDTHDRSSIVALLGALAMVAVAKGTIKWNGVRWVVRRIGASRLKVAGLLVLAAGMAFFLIARGHESIAHMEEVSFVRGQEALRKNDTAMLPVLYFESHLAEKRGYDYGVPLLTRALFGYLPRQFFPWKDDLDELLLDQDARQVSGTAERWLYGAKSTVVGSFYGHGGPFGVFIGMVLLSLATRRLDRLVVAGRTDITRALGITWMANLWMMLASSDIWIMQNLFINAMPFLGLWVVMKLTPGAPAPAKPAF